MRHQGMVNDTGQTWPTVVGLALPALAMGVAILDTLFSISRRILQRRGIFSPDRGHIHHRLLAMGFTQQQVALMIYVVTLVATLLGLFMVFQYVHGRQITLVFFGVLAIEVLVFRWAAR